MKKILLFLSFLLVSIGMWSADETVVFSSQGYTNGQAITSYNGTNFSISFNKGSNSNAPKYYTTGSAIRCYGGNYFTVSSNSKTIIKIELVFGNGDGSNSISSDVITYSNGEWNGESSSIKFTISGSSGHRRIASVAVTYKADDTPCDSVSITLLPTSHGTTSLSKTRVCPDDEIEVTYTPDDGYMLDKILANDVEVENPITITENTTIQVLFKEIPPEPSIDVAEWNPDYIKVNIDNFDGVTAIIENQNTQQNVEKFADSLFFSKYFESKGNVKLLGIYNGTNHNIDLTNYRVKIGEKGSDYVSGTYAWGRTLYPDSMNRMLNAGEEIIFIAYDKSATSPDTAVIKCAKNNEKANWNSYIYIGNMNFNGNDAVGLFNPDGNLIDIIGAGNKTNENLGSSASVGVVAAKEFMDDPGWYSPDGININTNDSNYALSTARCLLVRKNTVKSGLNAVSRNTSDFVTLGGQYGEWLGLQVSKNDPDKGVAASCIGFDYVGTYDYNSYYAKYETIIEETPLSSILQSDGTYKFDYEQLDTLSCTNLKVIAKNDEESIEKSFKIPIMVKVNSLTTDELFTKEGPDCVTCDVVVLSNKILTVAGTSSQNRDVKVYGGGTLSVPTGTTYTISSLALRRTDNTPAYLSLYGNLNLSGDSSLFLDIYTDPSDWCWMALPESFRVKNITKSNGKNAVFGTDYLIKTYDGNKRSTEQRNGWIAVGENKIFSLGEGFIFGIAGEGTIKQEYRFKFANTALDREKVNKTLSWETLKAWGCTTEGLAPNHIGWNLIGNPYFTFIGTEIYSPIRIGHLIKDPSGDTWNGKWIVDPDESDARLRYRVVKCAPELSDDGSYRSELLDDIYLEPFECFFVQLGGNNTNPQSMILDVNKRRSIVTRHQVDEDDELFLRVYVDSEKTGWFISDKFMDDYEPGDDFESRRSIYQSINGYKLLYSAIPDSTLISGVTVHSNGGHIALDEKVMRDKFEYVYVYQNNNWYDLMLGDYDIESGDFTVYAKRKTQDTPTGFEYIIDDPYIKYLDNKYIYLKLNGHVFTIDGKLIK